MNRRLGRVAGCLALAIATARCADKIAPPLANAGTSVTADMGGSVLLDGTASTDPQGRALLYDWSFANRPPASRASFNDAHIAKPSFVPDLDGQYVVALVVSNGVLSSPPSNVTVTVRKCGEAAPVVTAVTATPANPNAGTQVQLDAAVTDADNSTACGLNQTFTLLWTTVSRPGTSSTALSDPTAKNPTITPDVVGAYQFSVVATDSTGLQSAPKFVTFKVAACGAAAVTFDGPPITAVFAETRPNVGAAVTLTAHPIDPGVACGVPAGTVQYRWTLAGPSGSTAVSFATQAGTQFSFTPDVVGTYDVTVRAVDAQGHSSDASTSISTTTCGVAPIAVQVNPASSTVNSFDSLPLTATPAATTCPARFAPTIAWAVSGVGAPAQLSSSSGTAVSFRASGPGDYVVSAVAINTSGQEGPVGTASVQVDACGSHPPVVVTTNNSPTFPARLQTVALSATAVDPDTACGAGRPSSIAFELVSIPQGSALTFPAGATTFQGDVEGTYSFRVVATESGTGLRSDAAILNVTVLDPDATASTVVTTSATTVVANNVDAVTVTTTLRNRFNQPNANLPVNVAVSGSANTLTPGAIGTTDVNGVFVTALTTTKAETKTITVTANPGPAQVVLNTHPQVTFVAGPTASIALTGLPSTVTAGVASTVTVTAFDKFANVAKGPNAYTGTVHFTSTDPFPATLPPDFTFASTDNGTHTFINGVTLFTAGSQTVTVTDTVTATFTSSQTATVNSAPTASIALTGTPATITAGIAFTVTVTAHDAFNNVAKGPNAYTGTVHFTSTDPFPATLPANFTFAPTDNGTHTFTNGVTLFTAGSQTVRVTDTVTTAFTSSQTATVNSAATASIALAGTPASVTAGVAFTVSVTAHDAFGNVAKGPNAYTGTVHFTSTDPFPATLPANFTFASTDNGTHAFTNGVTLFTAGSQTVTATDTVTAAFTSSQTTTANSAAAASITLAGTPATITAGVAFTVTVTAHDAFNNVAKGPNAYTGTVHFTSTDPFPATLPANFTFASTDNGTHTFTNGVTLFTAGSRTVTVTDTVNATLTSSQTTTVTAAAAVSLAVTGLPSPFPTGTAQSFTVTALDQFGNTATGYRGTVNFTSSDALAVFTPASYTFVALDNGTHLFAGGVKLSSAGPQSVTATDTVAASITGSQGTTVSGLQFAKQATGVANTTTTGNAVASFSDGSFAVTGKFTGTTTWGPGEVLNAGLSRAGATTVTTSGTADLFVARYNADGALRWVKTVGPSPAAAVTTIGVGIAGRNLDGSAVVVGSFTGVITFPTTPTATTLTPVGATDLFIAKYDSAGALAWVRQARGSAAGTVIPAGIAGYADGTTVTTGSYSGTPIFGFGEAVSAGHAGQTTLPAGGFFLARYNLDGTLFSVTSAGASGSVTSKGVAALADGTVVAVGDFTANTTFGAAPQLTLRGTRDAFAVKYDTDGTTVVWATSAGGAGPPTAAASATAVAAFGDGKLVLTGNFNNTITLGTGVGAQTVVAAGTQDVFIARLNADGTAAWAKQAGTAGATGTGLGAAAFDVDGTAAVVGRYSTPTTFAFGTTNLTPASVGVNDLFVARYTSAGAVASAKTAGGAGDDSANAVAGFSDTGALVIGSVSPPSSTFGSGEPGQTILSTAATATDLFAAKYYPYAQ